MGLFNQMFQEIAKQGEAILKEKYAPPPTSDPAHPPTRWEKAIVALNGIVDQVSQIDPDGVDVVCFGGDGAPDVYRNVKDTKGLEAMVTAKTPSGACHMGAAMDTVLAEALAKQQSSGSALPCSILVLTAGRPNDHETLDKAIQQAATTIAETMTTDDAKKGKGKSPLTITFVQVGDDEEAETYLKHLDDNLTTTAAASGATVDIVDTIKDEEIKKAMKEFKTSKKGSVGGALFGAFAGAAMGVGGMYVMNKINANQRTEGWNGDWKATFEGEEIAVLKVVDDKNGNITVEGLGETATTGHYAENDDGGYNIQFTDPDEKEPIFGTVIDKHTISWSDGTRWEEVPPKGGHWAAYGAAAAAGAVAGTASGGASGALLDKKFFSKASNKVPSDYVIVLDRSSMMAVPDTGK